MQCSEKLERTTQKPVHAHDFKPYKLFSSIISIFLNVGAAVGREYLIAANGRSYPRSDEGAVTRSATDARVPRN
jgi:hypothetical protein